MDGDVTKNGIPPSCLQILDGMTHAWNKCMGNVDCVRNTLENHKVKRGRNTKPGYLSWHSLFQYALYQSF